MTVLGDPRMTGLGDPRITGRGEILSRLTLLSPYVRQTPLQLGSEVGFFFSGDMDWFAARFTA